MQFNENMEVKKRVVANFETKDPKEMQMYDEDMPTVTSGFRKTAVSEEFERFIAEGKANY